VVTEGAVIQRSQITGELLVKVKKLTPNHVIANVIKREKEKKIKEKKEKEKKKRQEDEKIKLLIEK